MTEGLGGERRAAGRRRILVSGSTGLIGRGLVERWRAAGDEVVALVRRAPVGKEEIRWEPGVAELDPAMVSGFDAVVHLAGEPVLGLWTSAKKRRILESRVKGTETLVRALMRTPRPPAVMLCASGVNFYGATRAGVVDERSAAGSGFLAEVCKAWEAACDPLRARTRVVNLRIGVVLAREGGTLQAMLPVFRLGLGGVAGGGRGSVSWITLGDLQRAMDFILEHEEMQGAVNLVSPEPATGRELARALGAALHRPAVLPVPASLVRLALGRFGEETVLGDVRAMPRKLLEAGFRFEDETLREALAACGVG